MSDRDNQDDARPSRADVDDIADASLGVDTRIFRTIWDTLLHTPRVLSASYSGERETYVPVIRLFLILFGMFFGAMTMFGLPVGMTLDALNPQGDNTPDIEYWLQPSGQSYDAVNETLEQAGSWTVAPLNLLASLPFVLLLKAYRPSRSFFGHTLAFLVPVNASYIVINLIVLALVVARLTGVIGEFSAMFLFVVGMLISTIWYFVATGRIIMKFYGQSAIIVAFQLVGLFLMVIPMAIITVVGQYAVAELALRIIHDLSLVDLFEASIQT